jgi:hypothetical protein
MDNGSEITTGVRLNQEFDERLQCEAGDRRL